MRDDKKFAQAVTFESHLDVEYADVILVGRPPSNTRSALKDSGDEIVLETRRCPQCKRPYRTLPTSKQVFDTKMCSDFDKEFGKRGRK